MSNLKPHRPRDRAVVPKADGNPEGKGLNGFLLDWYRSEPRGVVAKPGRQILAEFFTSMLVLSAEFKYQPVVGVANYLYWIEGTWSLSLIAPDEWSEARRAGFVGTCILQDDMTWTIQPSERVGRDSEVAEAIGRFYDAFSGILDTELTLEEILPFHVAGMPYYQRLYASALSRSIRGAVILGDQRGRPARDWRVALPGLNRLLS